MRVMRMREVRDKGEVDEQKRGQKEEEGLFRR